MSFACRIIWDKGFGKNRGWLNCHCPIKSLAFGFSRKELNLMHPEFASHVPEWKSFLITPIQKHFAWLYLANRQRTNLSALTQANSSRSFSLRFFIALNFVTLLNMGYFSYLIKYLLDIITKRSTEFFILYTDPAAVSPMDRSRKTLSNVQDKQFKKISVFSNLTNPAINIHYHLIDIFSTLFPYLWKQFPTSKVPSSISWFLRNWRCIVAKGLAHVSGHEK